jgi:predicted nucleic acid-binding protein
LFQRWFDDPYQVRIQLEALACQEIFVQAEHKKLILIWSFMHQDETVACPFPDRAFEAVRLSKLCEIIVAPEDSIYETAKGFLERAGLSAKDALHVACAHWAHNHGRLVKIPRKT